MYIHELKDWPNFTWDSAKLSVLIADVRYSQGRLLGRMEQQGFNLREEATLHTLTEDVLKSSEIEGEKLDAELVRSSVARHLGLEFPGSLQQDRYIDGVVEVMLDATRNYNDTLTEDRLFSWHAALFPTGKSGMYRITLGDWRTDVSGPMQVVSGAYGREKVHFQAPNSQRLKHEMKIFIRWMNTKKDMDPVIKSAFAHLWFVTIHPFDDGNGRIARALGDMYLAKSEECNQRFYSMSSQIQRERKAYYEILERSQKGTLDITAWIEWYLGCLHRAMLSSDKILATVLKKSHFWASHLGESYNDRQKKIINLLINGFTGKLTSSKWAKICKCSQDTALRDINDLIERTVLKKDVGGGRSTSYGLSD